MAKKNFFKGRRMRRILFILLLIPFLALCTSYANAQFDELESLNGEYIKKVSFSGVSHLRYTDLSRGLSIKPGIYFNQENLLESIAILNKRMIFESIDVSISRADTGLDIAFLLSPILTYAVTEFSGNRHLNQRQLQRLTRIRHGKKFELQDLVEAKKNIEAEYKKEGFYTPIITFLVSQRYLAPQIVTKINIEEGYRSTISNVVLEGLFPEDVFHLRDIFIEHAMGIPASTSSIENLRSQLLYALRNEGYLEANVRLRSTVYEPLSGNVGIVIQVDTKDPLTLNFYGNDSISTEELLSLLRLEERKVPFGPTAIPNFVKDISVYYEQQGFYGTVVSFAKQDTDGLRDIYDITVQEAPLSYIKSIHFQGNKFFSDAVLRKSIQSERRASVLLRRWRRGYLVESMIKDDIDTLEEMYQLEGFLDANIDYLIKRDGDATRVIFDIKEGQLSHINNIDIVWKNLFHEGREIEYNAHLLAIRPQLSIGDRYQRGLIDRERSRLTQLIQNLGYPDVDVSLETTENEGIIKFIITPGVRIRINEVYNAGNMFSHDFVINRELRFKSGDFWSPTKVQRSEHALYQTGLFRSVDVLKDDSDANTKILEDRDVFVHVEERDSGNFELGFSLNTEDGLHLDAELGQRNLSGYGNSLVFGIDGYFKTGERLFDAGRGRITYTMPHFLDSKGLLISEVFTQSVIELNSQYSYDRTGLSLLYRYPLLDNIITSLGYSFFTEHVFDVPNDMVLGSRDQNSHLMAILRTTIEFDYRDDNFNPRAGYKTTIQPILASKAIGSETNFYGASFQQSVLTPLSDELVWANSFNANILEPFSSTEVIPLTQRFFLGGRNSLRGFSPNVIGPRGDELNVVGGDRSINFTTQLQYDITESFVGIAFFDAGQSILRSKGDFFTGDGLSFSKLRYSPGLGIQYKTPIGPLSIEYGFALKREFGERFGRLHISIGQRF
jgi:outer membrane protein insertion porin family